MTPSEPNPRPAPSPKFAPRPPQSPAVKGTVLLVEDDFTSANALALILRRIGWDVLTVATIREAMAVLDTSSPTAVILDLMLPDGDGIQILERIRHDQIHTKVAVTTASSDSTKLDRVRALQPDSMMFKPIDLPQLLRAL